jgi:excisionase family DNA binding protein
MADKGRRGYLSIKDAAAWTSISERTLTRWIARGLPVYQAGPRGKVLIRPPDIDAFLQRRQRPKPDLDRLVDEVMQDLTAGQKQGRRAK